MAIALRSNRARRNHFFKRTRKTLKEVETLILHNISKPCVKIISFKKE